MAFSDFLLETLPGTVAATPWLSVTWSSRAASEGAVT